MRVLVIGSGGREHALAWAIAKSPRLEKLYVAPGNGGTERLATNVPLDISDNAAVVAFAQREAIDLVVIGPDAPAVAGLGDAVRAGGLLCFGPSQKAAQLEGKSVASTHLRHLNPLPPDLGQILRQYRRVLVPEINSGQLVRVLRAEYLVDAVGYNRVSGMPLASQDILEAINQLVEATR